MGVRFTDPSLYVMSQCSATFRNRETGKVEYFTDKVTDFSEAYSSNDVVIRAGFLNGIQAIVTTDQDIQVTANTAAYSLKMQMMQVGGKYEQGGIAPKCKTITATGTSLTLDVSDGTPVAAPGYTDIFCHVQEVGVSGTVGETGNVYPLTAAGAISGFTAVSGKTYKVWYWVNQIAAITGTVFAAINPGVYHATFQRAVFKNVTGEANKGTRVGWLYVVYPVYRLGGTPGTTGGQTANDTTNLGGRVTANNSDVITAECDDCTFDTSAYYIYVPDEAATDIDGLALVGGVLTVPTNSTKTIDEFVVAFKGGGFAKPDPAFMSYELTSAPSGTTVSGSVITTGATAGDCDIVATYDDGETELECTATLSVVSA